MKRISIDFNTLNSAPVGLVKISDPDDADFLSLQQGERVLLVEPGLEAEGTIILKDGRIMWRFPTRKPIRIPH